MKNKILVTGGAGFIGTRLVGHLLNNKVLQIVVLDQLDDKKIDLDKRVTYFRGDISSKKDVQDIFEKHGPFETVFHLASAMPDKVVPDDMLWKTNVHGTSNLIAEAVKNNTKSFVFTSSNVTYGVPKELPVNEDTPVIPLEIYGKSKVIAEGELEKFRDKINIQIFRCPVTTGIGRLGLQAILYEFISEDKNVYMLGKGLNKYQFVDVTDLVDALEKASRVKGFDIYTVGADEVVTLRQIYQSVIKFAGSKSKIVSLPILPALLLLSILDKLNLSPLGVYQYTMLGRSIYADTTKIKTKLNWKPKKTNTDTFIENYKWYIKNKNTFGVVGSSNLSANRSVPKMRILKLIKMIS